MEYLLIGYLLGSIPFGLLLCFLFGYGDIRKIGSGNIGATNVLRTGNKFLALITLILDISKGGIAVLIAKKFAMENNIAVYAGLFAIIGHNFPLWLKFKGGKGIATTIGTIIVISPIIGSIVISIWVLVAFMFKYSSLAGMLSLISAPIIAIIFKLNHLILPFSIITVMALIKHRKNIAQLINGTEPKIKIKK